MILYIEATVEGAPRINSFDVLLRSGKQITMDWDETDIICEEGSTKQGGHYSLRCKGVYFDDEYANGRIEELEGATFIAAHCSNNEDDDDEWYDLIISEIVVCDGKERMSFPCPLSVFGGAYEE